jgi:hypothetical protein
MWRDETDRPRDDRVNVVDGTAANHTPLYKALETRSRTVWPSLLTGRAATMPLGSTPGAPQRGGRTQGTTEKP